jgi:hypothetical protein
VARLPDLQTEHRDVFGYSGKAYPTIAYSYGEMQKEYFLINTTGDLPPEEELKSRFGWPSTLHLEVRPHHHLLGDFPGVEFRLSQGTSTSDELKAHYPIKNDRDGFPYLVEPFENGYQLSTISVMFAISYFAGMLVRYFPSRWAVLNFHEGKDKEHSLLIRALDIIEERFPQLILDELKAVPSQEGRYRRW